MKKVMHIIYLLFCLMPVIAPAQSEDSTFKDFNNDGHTDTLNSFYSGGSGYGGKYFELRNGANDDKYEINTYGCFCQIKQTIPIPAELRKKENKPFLEALKKEISSTWRISPDPSLKWILDANNSVSELSDNPYFDLAFNFRVEWIKGRVTLPDTYFIEIKNNRFYYPEELSPDDRHRNFSGWLAYYAHNHYRNPEGDSLVPAGNSSNYEASKTSHGLIVHNEEDSHAWIFVTDYDLTGGPQKLRWESIERVKIYKGHAFVLQSRAMMDENNIFIIDIENGVCARLRYSAVSNPFLNEFSDKLIEELSVLNKSFEK